MARITAKDTSIEVIFRKKLWNRGIRCYRKNYKNVFGKPDIVFPRFRVAVFCDSEFWHGKKMLNGEIPRNNKDFWINKLQKNISRDRTVNKVLRSKNWTILRFWQKDIIKNTERCVDRVEKVLRTMGL